MVTRPHRHQHLDSSPFGLLTTRRQEAADSARHRRQQEIVDRHPELLDDSVQLEKRLANECHLPTLADRAVERKGGRDALPGEQLPARPRRSGKRHDRRSRDGARRRARTWRR